MLKPLLATLFLVAVFSSQALALSVENTDAQAYYLKIGSDEKPIPIKAGGILDLPCSGGCRVRLIDVKSGKAIDMIEAETATRKLFIRNQGLSEQ